MPTPSTLIVRPSVAIDKILTILECISDEAFWERVFGQRVVNLGKRYFGNDFVVLSLGFYIATILQTKWQQLLAFIWMKLEKQKNQVSITLTDSSNIYRAVDAFVRKNSNEIPDLVKLYAFDESDDSDSDDDNEEEGDSLPVVAFIPPDDVVQEFEYKGYKIFARRGDEKDDDSEENNTKAVAFRSKYLIKKLTISMEGNNLPLLKQFIQEWSDMYNSKQSDKTAIKKSNGYSWYTYKIMEPRPLHTVVLKEGIKEMIIQDMETFRRRKRWYKTRGVPYRRGYCLFGPPGTGKTSLIQALACKLGMDVAIISLREVLSDSEFLDMMSEAPSNAIIVLEDFDHYGNTTGSGQGVTLAGILNALDGIQGQSGSMIFMTCNDITKIPPPLLRPGRMDIKVKLDYADRQQIEEMFFKFFGYDPDTLEPLVDGPEKNRIDNLKRRFADIIPENKVTTAELESYFIALWMEADPQNPENGVFERIFSGVPEFLQKVELDREQARLHYNKKAEGDDTKVPDDSSPKEEDSPSSPKVEIQDPPTPPLTDLEEKKAIKEDGDADNGSPSATPTTEKEDSAEK